MARVKTKMLAKKDFLEMIQSAFTKTAAGKPINNLSREKAEEWYCALFDGITEEAKKNPISIRGLGKFYIIRGKTGNEYLRFQISLSKAPKA